MTRKNKNGVSKVSGRKTPQKKTLAAGSNNSKSNSNKKVKSRQAEELEFAGHGGEKENSIANNAVAMHIISVILAILSLYILISFVMNGNNNDSSMRDIGGIGVFSRNIFYGLFGGVSVLAPFFMGSIAFFLKRDLESGFFKYRVIFSVSCLILYACIFHLSSKESAEVGYNAARLFDNGKIYIGGGVFGGFLCETLRKCVGNVGAWIFVIPLSLVFSVFLFGQTPIDVIKGAVRLVHDYGEKRRKGYERRILIKEKDPKRRFKVKTHKYRIASNIEVLRENSRIRANGAGATVGSNGNKSSNKLNRLNKSDKPREDFQIDIPFDGFDGFGENNGNDGNSGANKKESTAYSAEHMPDRKKRLIDIGENPFDKINADMNKPAGAESSGNSPVMIPEKELFENSKNGDKTNKPNKPEKECEKLFDGFDAESDGNNGGNINNNNNSSDSSNNSNSSDNSEDLDNLEVIESAPQIRGDEPEMASELVLEKSKVFGDSKNEDIHLIKREYKLPPISYLTKEINPVNVDISEELKTTAQKLIDTLEKFGVKTKIYGCSRGPSITRYEISPDSGVKVNSIVNLVNDIALHLAADIRIEAPIPGKSAIGVEVPNKNREIVHLRSLLEEPQFINAASKITIALGKDVSGNAIYSDIAKMPHLLIAGATGMGKSVCINAIIMSILFKATPDEVKLIFIDPKKVELNRYNGIPHLLVPVVSDPKKAAGSLSWAVNEMENRYMLIEEKGVRDLKSYNEAIADDPFIEPLPQIVIIIDELADLMLTAPADVEQSINRIAAKARAAGMHLIIGTQRPSVDVITGLIKANIPARIAFTTVAQQDSRTIINIAGAEKLIGVGDMLYLPIGVTKPIRVQGAFVSDKDLSNIAEFWKKQSDGEYDEAILNEIEQEAARCNTKGAKIQSKDDEASTDEELDKEPMLKPAIEIAIDTGRISTSLLQTKLSLGYARAARIVNTMEKMNLIGPFEGSKPRKVLITKQDFIEMTMNSNTFE